MDPARFTRVDDTTWRVEPSGTMRVPAIIYADENLIQDMDDKVLEQATNVARLPGIVQASYVMPDAHWGYGFPIGGVAAFDPDQGGFCKLAGLRYQLDVDRADYHQFLGQPLDVTVTIAEESGRSGAGIAHVNIDSQLVCLSADSGC